MASKLSAGEKVCWYCVLTGALMVGGPGLFPDAFEWNGGQYAMGLVGLLIALSAFVSVFLFRARRKGRETLTSPSAKLLAHWTYKTGEWAAFVGEDFEREQKMKWSLFRIVASLCLVIGGIFWVLDPDKGGPWVFGVMLSLVLVIMGVIVIGTRVSRDSRRGMVLENCDLVEGQPPCIEFVYSTPAKNGRQTNSVRVPAPQGRDQEVRELVDHFQSMIETS